MEPKDLFRFLTTADEKPAPFSVYTADTLWTDEHTSEQMLAFHLDGEVDLSSRSPGFMDHSVRWMRKAFGLGENSRIIDFGCGPGLYTSRFAELGSEVCGVDFSGRSIRYARDHAEREGLEVTYVEADYLAFEPQGRFDLITMIMCDFCALSPGQRAEMLLKFKCCLARGGRIVLDVYSLSAFAAREEVFSCEKNQLHGFWSAEPYWGFFASHKYPEERVSLDKYTIIERDRERVFYNWLQYFSPESLESEAHGAGLEIEAIVGDVAGRRFDPEAAVFAAVLRVRR